MFIEFVCKLYANFSLYSYALKFSFSMINVKTATVLDTRKIKKDNTYPVKLRVTFERKQRYYSTPYNFVRAEFDKVMYGKRLSEKEKVLKNKVMAFENKAMGIIELMPIFNWDKFEKQFNTNRATKDTVNTAFNEYSKKLKEERRLGTAASYACARVSLNKFFPNSKFTDITPEFLKKYEKWILDAGGSITTVGIYLRSLRTMFNEAIAEGIIQKEFYPFGSKKYEIPTGSNTKKALTLKEIGAIYNFKAKPNTPLEFSKDMWLFMYFCNGINVKDLCLLKYENIKGDFLEFNRAKTARTKRKVEPIRVPLNDDLKGIISRYGNSAKEKGNYIFKILSNGLTPERERELIKQFNSNINDQMKNIATQLGIDGKLTTYVARHSFSTILQRSGASTEFISNALGHSNVITTQNYLAGFEDESKIEISKALTAFKLVHQE